MIRAIAQAIAEHKRETAELTAFYAMRDAQIIHDLERQLREERQS